MLIAGAGNKRSQNLFYKARSKVKRHPSVPKGYKTARRLSCKQSFKMTPILTKKLKKNFTPRLFPGTRSSQPHKLILDPLGPVMDKSSSHC
jgi:hypothetical protein